VRVSRRVKDLAVQIIGARPELSQHVGHGPDVIEMAAHLHVTPAEVEEANAALRSYRMLSLVPLLADDDAVRDTLACDGGVGPDHVLFQAALAELDGVDRRILVLRFFEGLSQAEIAERLGTNQVQVSRQLRKIFVHLRQILDRGDDLSIG
jgi:RNA polymerase sigma-B factor